MILVITKSAFKPQYGIAMSIVTNKTFVCSNCLNACIGQPFSGLTVELSNHSAGMRLYLYKSNSASLLGVILEFCIDSMLIMPSTSCDDYTSDICASFEMVLGSF